MKHKMSYSWSVLLTLLVAIPAIVAQGICSELLEAALASADVHCQELARNTACYGFDTVQAAFLTDISDDFFAFPGDMTDLFALKSIATSSFDEQSGEWGVAVMSIQANIPNTLPGQNVTFILMGDTEVENAVAPDAAFIPVEGFAVTVSAVQGANVRSGPGLNYNVIGAAGHNAILQADGQSADGQWLRVAYNNRLGWISRIVLADDSAFNELPVLTPELQTTMQAFYLRTGIGPSSCDELPDDMLVVQGPNNLEIEITVNGAHIVIGSTIGLRVVEIEGNPFLDVIVFNGRAEVEGVTLRAGSHSVLCLGEPDNLGLDGTANDRVVICEPSPPEPVANFGEEWCLMEQVPTGILNYPIEILCPGETPPPGTVTTNSDNTGATQSQIAGVDCSSFDLVGPTSGITPRPTTFEWTSAPGASEYEIVFYNYFGGVAQTFFTTETNIHLNVGEIPTGSELQWEVRAWQNGQYACVTSRTPVITRLVDPLGVPAPGSGFSAWMTYCNINPPFANQAGIAWNNAPDGSVGIEWSDFTSSTTSSTFSGESGSTEIQGTPDIYNIRVSSGGTTINLGNCA